MNKGRPVPDLSPESRQDAISELSALAKRLAVASHSIMQKAVNLASEDRKDHEKAIRSMRRYRGSGQPEQAAVLEIEAAVTGLSTGECLAYTQTQTGYGHLRCEPRPISDLLEHEGELVRVFRQGTTAQRAAILSILKEDQRERDVAAQKHARHSAKLDRLMEADRAEREAAKAPPPVRRATFTVIDGGF